MILNSNLGDKLNTDNPRYNGFLYNDALLTSNKQVVGIAEKKMYIGNGELDSLSLEYAGKSIPVSEFVLNSSLELKYANAQYSFNNANGNMHLRKYGKVVFCLFANIITVPEANKSYYLSDGKQVIPDGFKPYDPAYVSFNLVVGETVSGSVRMYFNKDGTISFTSTVSDAREYSFSTMWITND